MTYADHPMHPPVTLCVTCVEVGGFCYPVPLKDKELQFPRLCFTKTFDFFLRPPVSKTTVKEMIAEINFTACCQARREADITPYQMRTDAPTILMKMCLWHHMAAFCVRFNFENCSVFIYLDGSCIVFPDDDFNAMHPYLSSVHMNNKLNYIFEDMAGKNCWKVIK